MSPKRFPSPRYITSLDWQFIVFAVLVINLHRRMIRPLWPMALLPRNPKAKCRWEMSWFAFLMVSILSSKRFNQWKEYHGWNTIVNPDWNVELRAGRFYNGVQRLCTTRCYSLREDLPRSGPYTWKIYHLVCVYHIGFHQVLLSSNFETSMSMKGKNTALWQIFSSGHV